MKRKMYLKKISAGLTALAACFSAVSANVSAADILKGDCNSDGVVSALDIVSMKSHLLNISEIEESGKKAADINADGSIDVIDFILLKNILLNDGPEENDSSVISLSDSGITVSGEGVSCEGNKVTVSKGGQYRISGSVSSDTSIVVSAADDDKDAVELILDNVSMTNSSDLACILVENADKTKITFTGTNTLTNTFEGASASSAAIYAKDDITFTKNCSGSLEISVNSCMGIYCNNDIKFNGGSFKIKTDSDGTGTNSADAVKAKGSVENAGAEISVNAAGDGVKSTKDSVTFSGGKTKIKSGKDAVQAEVSVNISGGTLAASGDRGITSAAGLNITGGSVIATATDNQITFTENTSTQKMAGFEFADEHSKDDIIKIDNTEFAAAKKYKYVMISDSSLTAGKPFSLFCGDMAYTHDSSADGRYILSDDIFTQYKGVTVQLAK